MPVVVNRTLVWPVSPLLEIRFDAIQDRQGFRSKQKMSIYVFLEHLIPGMGKTCWSRFAWREIRELSEYLSQSPVTHSSGAPR